MTTSIGSQDHHDRRRSHHIFRRVDLIFRSFTGDEGIIDETEKACSVAWGDGFRAGSRLRVRGDKVGIRECGLFKANENESVMTWKKPPRVDPTWQNVRISIAKCVTCWGLNRALVRDLGSRYHNRPEWGHRITQNVLDYAKASWCGRFCCSRWGHGPYRKSKILFWFVGGGGWSAWLLLDENTPGIVQGNLSLLQDEVQEENTLGDSLVIRCAPRNRQFASCTE